jgi:hypothetical protein
MTETEIVYRITPVEGYVIHSKSRDWTDENFETGEETFYRGYGRGTMTVGKNYDFENTTEIDGYTAYGFLEIFARPASEVPENQIFGGGGNNEVRSDVE